MVSNTYVMISIAIIAGVTFLLRALPFVIFKDKKVPAYIDFLGKYLPYAIMGILVIYCLKGVSFLRVPFGIPEIIAVAAVASLHIWKRNTLLSIVSGTICYMLLIRFWQ